MGLLRSVLSHAGEYVGPDRRVRRNEVHENESPTLAAYVPLPLTVAGLSYSRCFGRFGGEVIAVVG